ncbi:uncharacterized protein LOC110629484 [Manihot esculenta]|nr:uncharacterized protein LOC110629484 [Manihot esculenta]
MLAPGTLSRFFILFEHNIQRKKKDDLVLVFKLSGTERNSEDSKWNCKTHRRREKRSQSLISQKLSSFNRSRLSDLPVNMTTSRRLADRKVEKFEKNITKRGAVPETTTKKGKDYPVGPVLLGFFVFVVIGSSLFQIIRTATSGGMA